MSLKIPIIERGASSHGAHSYAKKLSCPYKQQIQDPPGGSLRIGILLHAALEYCHNMEPKDLRCATFDVAEDAYSENDCKEALRLARAYLAVPRFFDVTSVEHGAEAIMGWELKVTGRFDATVSVDAEQAIQASQRSDVTGIVTPGNWILDYKTVYTMERFDAKAYAYGPQGLIYQYLGLLNGWKGLIYAAISRDHPSQVQFFVHEFTGSLKAMERTIELFALQANDYSRTATVFGAKRDLRDCYGYGRLCPRFDECFGQKEVEHVDDE